jgi:hypothetical protein
MGHGLLPSLRGPMTPPFDDVRPCRCFHQHSSLEPFPLSLSSNNECADPTLKACLTKGLRLAELSPLAPN